MTWSRNNTLNTSWPPTRGWPHIVRRLQRIKSRQPDRTERVIKDLCPVGSWQWCFYEWQKEIQSKGEQNKTLEPSGNLETVTWFACEWHLSYFHPTHIYLCDFVQQWVHFLFFLFTEKRHFLGSNFLRYNCVVKQWIIILYLFYK